MTARAQIGLFAAAYALYGAGRWLVIGDYDAAVQHAHWIVGLEQHLHVAVEGSVQRALDGTTWLTLLGCVYLAAQLVAVPAALLVLFWRRSPQYLRLRDTVLASWLLAMPVFWLFPVAPPRLAGVGITDTLGSALHSRLATSVYNPLAAVPSLHCGFALTVSIALARSTRSAWSRALAIGWTPLVVLAVVATGNHFFFDVAAGLLTTLVAFPLTRLPERS